MSFSGEKSMQILKLQFESFPQDPLISHLIQVTFAKAPSQDHGSTKLSQ